jgi:hypothetical protein
MIIVCDTMSCDGARKRASLMMTKAGKSFAHHHHASSCHAATVLDSMYLSPTRILCTRSLINRCRSVFTAPAARQFSTHGPHFAAYNMPQAPKITAVDALPADEAKWYAPSTAHPDASRLIPHLLHQD